MTTASLRLSQASRHPVAESFTVVRDAWSKALDVLGMSLAGLVYAVVFLAPWAAVGGLGWWIARIVRARRLRARASVAG